MPQLGSTITTKIDNDMLVIWYRLKVLSALPVSKPEIGVGEVTDAPALILCLTYDFFVVARLLVMELHAI